MRKITRILAVPAALFIGLIIGIKIQSVETVYWHAMAARVASSGEDRIGALADGMDVCLDVIAGDLTYQEGTSEMLEINTRLDEYETEYDAILNELKLKK